MADVELLGLRELEQKLLQLEQVAGDKVMIKAMRKGLKIILDSAKRNIAPFIKNQRKAKFTTRNIKTGSAKTFQLQAKPTKGFWFAHIFEEGARPHTIAVKSRKALARDGKFYGRAVRHPGIRKTQFFSRAFDQNAQKAISAFSASLSQEIDKAAK